MTAMDLREVPFYRSIFARQVVWATVISLIAVVLLWAVTATTIASATKQTASRAVNVDLAGLADIYVSGGQEELVKRIDDRLALADAGGDVPHYMLADGAGRRIAGDLARWPGLSASQSEAGVVVLPGGREVYARATQLGPDLRLVVAREYAASNGLRRDVDLAFLAAGALVVLAVALAGRLSARRLASRINRINRAFRSPDEATLEGLAPGGRARDEIGELARHSLEALARLKRMVTKHRETSDQIAHELRTPLMHLDNRLVKALRVAGDDETRAMLADARAEIRSVIALLESLLDIATSEARRGDRHGLAPVDLSALADRIGELYADSAEESGHTFVRAIAPGVALPGEEMQLTRVITNLLDNAFKYVPEGGTVRLEVSPGPVLTVSDDGPGVPPEDRPFIFDRFQRGSRARGEGQGAGLGLALARAIAERHGLTLALVPSEKGACFRMAPGETA